MKFISLSLLMMISLNVFANERCEEEADSMGGGGGSVAEIVKFVEGQECPNKKKLKNICTSISGRMPDKEGKNKYLYQTKLLEAACVTSQDSNSVKIEKIKKAWAQFEGDLKCNSAGFDVTDGNLLKYAFSNEFEEFLNDAIAWKVNLNKVDPSDNRTLLDYIQFYIQKNKGNELEQRYKNYYLKFKDAGAKHKTEL